MTEIIIYNEDKRKLNGTQLLKTIQQTGLIWSMQAILLVYYALQQVCDLCDLNELVKLNLKSY